jgi:hypothetical protein
MTADTAIIVAIVVSLACATAGALIGEWRLGAPWFGAIVGILLGPLGPLVVAVLPRRVFAEPGKVERVDPV